MRISNLPTSTIEMDGVAVQLTPLSLEQLLDLRLRLGEQVSDIRAQIDSAKTTRTTTGQYADPIWYRRASDALRVKGLYMQRVQLAITEIKKESHLRREAEETHKFHLTVVALEGSFIRAEGEGGEQVTLPFPGVVAGDSIYVIVAKGQPGAAR